MLIGSFTVPILTALSATVGAATTVSVGATPFVNGGPLEPHAQLSLSPIAVLEHRSGRASTTLGYVPSFTFNLPDAPDLEQPQLSHLGHLLHSYAATRRLQLSLRFDGAVGSYQQYQLRGPLAGGGSLTTTGTATVDYLTLTATAGADYMLSRRWLYQATLLAAASEATTSEGEELITPQKSFGTGQAVSYELNSRSRVGFAARLEALEAGSRQLASWSLGLTHSLRITEPTQLTLAAGVAEVRGMPGEEVRPEDERVSGSILATYGGTFRVGFRRATADLQASWQPTFDPLLDRTRALATLAGSAALPLSASFTGGLQVAVSAPTDSVPASTELDEMLAYIAIPFVQELSPEWSLGFGARATWSALHWQLPFEVHNSDYSAYLTLTYATTFGARTEAPLRRIALPR